MSCNECLYKLDTTLSLSLDARLAARPKARLGLGLELGLKLRSMGLKILWAHGHSAKLQFYSMHIMKWYVGVGRTNSP